MTEEQKKKEAFIASLAETIYDYFPEIWEVKYIVDERNEEFIHITYANNYSRSICVTADSLKALLFELGSYMMKH